MPTRIVVTSKGTGCRRVREGRSAAGRLRPQEVTGARIPTSWPERNAPGGEPTHTGASRRSHHKSGDDRSGEEMRPDVIGSGHARPISNLARGAPAPYQGAKVSEMAIRCMHSRVSGRAASDRNKYYGYAMLSLWNPHSRSSSGEPRQRSSISIDSICRRFAALRAQCAELCDGSWSALYFGIG